MTDEERQVIAMIKDAMLASAEAWAVLNDALPVLVGVSGKTVEELSKALSHTAGTSGWVLSMATLGNAKSTEDYWFTVCAETDLAMGAWDRFLSPIRPSSGNRPEGTWLNALEFAAGAMRYWEYANMYANEIADKYEQKI